MVETEWGLEKNRQAILDKLYNFQISLTKFFKGIRKINQEEYQIIEIGFNEISGKIADLYQKMVSDRGFLPTQNEVAELENKVNLMMVLMGQAIDPKFEKKIN